LLRDLGRATEADDVAALCAEALRAANATPEALEKWSLRVAAAAQAFDEDLSGRSRRQSE
jgi:hypothetical protein